MMKKCLLNHMIFAILFGIFALSGANLYAADEAQSLLPQSNSAYTKQLSKQERASICNSLSSQKNQAIETSADDRVIPSSVLANIYSTTRQISDSVAVVSVLGEALMCHATHAGKKSILSIGSVKIGNYPDIPVFLCGLIIYFFGFMLLLSITFYIVDISFKLGFAVIVLPIGIALWPFSWTKDKLPKLISIILKSAAIFVFLAMAVSYTLNIISVALNGLDDLFEAIDTNNTDYVSETFTIFSTHFLVIAAAFIYGFKLVGTAVADYADKFFPDKTFGKSRGSSPMHHLGTQAVDFAKKKVVAPVASFAGDVAMTQAGRLTEGAGRVLSGQYRSEKNGQQTNATPPSGLKKFGLGIIHSPGFVLTRVGQAMQDRKPRKINEWIKAEEDRKRQEEEDKKARQADDELWS